MITIFNEKTDMSSVTYAFQLGIKFKKLFLHIKNVNFIDFFHEQNSSIAKATHVPIVSWQRESGMRFFVQSFLKVFNIDMTTASLELSKKLVFLKKIIANNFCCKLLLGMS